MAASDPKWREKLCADRKVNSKEPCALKAHYPLGAPKWCWHHYCIHKAKGEVT